MTRAFRWRARCAPLLLTMTLALGMNVGLTPKPALAQNEPAPAEGEGDKSGRPLDGYLATGCLVGLALFLVGKTARRQAGR
jgi:hypothetical protein